MYNDYALHLIWSLFSFVVTHTKRYSSTFASFPLLYFLFQCSVSLPPVPLRLFSTLPNKLHVECSLSIALKPIFPLIFILLLFIQLVSQLRLLCPLHSILIRTLIQCFSLFLPSLSLFSTYSAPPSLSRFFSLSRSLAVSPSPTPLSLSLALTVLPLHEVDISSYIYIWQDNNNNKIFKHNDGSMKQYKSTHLTAMLYL